MGHRMIDHGKRVRMARSPGMLAVVTLVAMLLPAPGGSQAPTDAQSLVGEWRGSWKEQHRRRVTGQYSLWIHKVEENKVHGRAEVSGAAARTFSFVGTLDGDLLTYGENPAVELAIDGDRMRGVTQGPMEHDIELTKRK